MAFSSLSTDVMEQINEYNTKNLEFIRAYRKTDSIVPDTECKLF